MDNTLTRLVIILPVILVSMTLHEMVHAYVSHWLGDDTAYLQGRVSFNPLRHIDPVLTVALPLLLVLSGSTVVFGAAKPVPVNFMRLKHGDFGGALVGVSGPLVNLILAVVAAILLRAWLPQSLTLYKILGYTVIVNAGFFIFNMIPWPPLDGSRLLYAFAPRGLQEAMMRLESYGPTGLIIFMLLFLTILQGPLSNLILRFCSLLTGGLIA